MKCETYSELRNITTTNVTGNMREIQRSFDRPSFLDLKGGSWSYQDGHKPENQENANRRKGRKPEITGSRFVMGSERHQPVVGEKALDGKLQFVLSSQKTVSGCNSRPKDIRPDL